MRPDDDTPTDLAAVLSARICHDLVSPVGAIVNGVDLIRELGAGGLDDEFGMISQSAVRASGLLQFYRVAFGMASAEADAIGRATLRDRAEAMITTSRVSLRWSAPEGSALGRPEARLLCQLLLCARALAGMSGTVEVALGPLEAFPMSVSVHGDGAPDAGERLELLTGNGSGLTPRSVEFALARESARSMGVALTVDRLPGRITLLVHQR